MDVTKPYEFIGFGAMDVTKIRGPLYLGRPIVSPFPAKPRLGEP